MSLLKNKAKLVRHGKISLIIIKFKNISTVWSMLQFKKVKPSNMFIYMCECKFAAHTPQQNLNGNEPNCPHSGSVD